MEAQENDRTERLRSVLKRMERSIDDARHRRTRGTTPMDAGLSHDMDNTVIGSSKVPVPAATNRPFDSLDTPIKDSQPLDVKKVDRSTPGAVRDEGTMFDFEGPRLKARPKRRNAS